MDEDPYQVLNLQPDASLEEVKRAYFYIAQIYHPNKGGSEQQFLRFQNAYNQIITKPTYGTVAPRSFHDLKKNADIMPDVQYSYSARDFQAGHGFDNQKFNNAFSQGQSQGDESGYTYDVGHLTQPDRTLVDYRREYDKVTMEAESVTPMFAGGRGFDPMTFNKVFQHMKDQHKSTDLQEYTGDPAPSTSKEIVSCVNLDKRIPDVGYFAGYGDAYNMHQNPERYDRSFIEQCKRNPEVKRDSKLTQQEMRSRMNNYQNMSMTYNTDRLITDRNSHLQEVEGLDSRKAQQQLYDQRSTMQENSMDQFQKLMALRAPVHAHQGAGGLNYMDRPMAAFNDSKRETQGYVPTSPYLLGQQEQEQEKKTKSRKHKSKLSSEIKDIKRLVKDQQKIISQLMASKHN